MASSRFNKSFSIIPYGSVTTDMVNNSIDSSKDNMPRAIRGADNVLVIYPTENASAYSDYTTYHIDDLKNIMSSKEFNVDSNDGSLNFIEVKGDIKDVISSEIYDVEITTAGTGYDAGGLSATGGGPGAGFKGTYSVSGGAITRMIIINMGSGYTSLPTIVISHAGDGNAVLTPILRGEASEGNTRVLDMSLKDNLTYASDLTISSTGTQLKLAHNANDYATLSVADTGDLTIATVGDGTTDSDLILDVDGKIELNADLMTTGNGIQFKDASAKFADFQVHHSATWFYLYENGGASNVDFFGIECLANGETAINTTDAAGSAAHLTLDVDGDLTLDSNTGNFIAKKGGTEFSAANSSYAGMLLGYTKIQNLTATNGYDAITITNSMTVLATAQSTDLSIAFVVPPSGIVEIALNCLLSSSSKVTKFSLSSADSYSEVAAIHTYDSNAIKQDETDKVMVDQRFVVTGLTANASITYYIAAQASANWSFIYHGTNRTGATYSPPIIITATALPATIVTGE